MSGHVRSAAETDWSALTVSARFLNTLLLDSQGKMGHTRGVWRQLLARPLLMPEWINWVWIRVPKCLFPSWCELSECEADKAAGRCRRGRGAGYKIPPLTALVLRRPAVSAASERERREVVCGAWGRFPASLGVDKRMGDGFSFFISDAKETKNS